MTDKTDLTNMLSNCGDHESFMLPENMLKVLKVIQEVVSILLGQLEIILDKNQYEHFS